MQNKVMVCVTQQKTCERLIKKGSELAKDIEGSLYVIHVVNEKDKLLYNLSDGDALEYLFDITKELGADLVVKRSKNVINTLVEFASENEITHIVIGNSTDKSKGKKFSDKLFKKLPDKQIIM